MIEHRTLKAREALALPIAPLTAFVHDAGSRTGVLRGQEIWAPCSIT
jgi:hypothetical protein